jgi:hypothetical protein
LWGGQGVIIVIGLLPQILHGCVWLIIGKYFS